MKGVILAAGVGTRLGRPFPKSLSKLPDGERILGRQIRIFKDCGIRELYVVVGFKMGLIMEHFPDVFYKYNPIYYITNTAKSLYCALRHLDDDVIWANGDVVCDPAVLQQMIASERNTIAVNCAQCGEEEVKYRQSADGRVLAISKQVADADGEAVGVNRVQRSALPLLVEALRRCDDNDYFARGVEMLIDEGIRFVPLDISAHRCIEVDFENDLASARAMFAVQ